MMINREEENKSQEALLEAKLLHVDKKNKLQRIDFQLVLNRFSNICNSKRSEYSVLSNILSMYLNILSIASSEAMRESVVHDD